jgi:hypothetical protein
MRHLASAPTGDTHVPQDHHWRGRFAAIGAATFTITATPAGAAPFNHHRHYGWRPAVRFYSAPVTYGSCCVRRIVPDCVRTPRRMDQSLLLSDELL